MRDANDIQLPSHSNNRGGRCGRVNQLMKFMIAPLWVNDFNSIPSQLSNCQSRCGPCTGPDDPAILLGR